MRKLTQTLALLVLTLSLLGSAAVLSLRRALPAPSPAHIDRLGNSRIAR